MKAFLAVTILSECSTCCFDFSPPPSPPARLEEGDMALTGVPAAEDGSAELLLSLMDRRGLERDDSLGAGSYSSASRIRERGMIR